MIHVVVQVFGGLVEETIAPEGVDVEVIDFDGIQIEHGFTKGQIFTLMDQMRDGYDPDAVTRMVESIESDE